MNIIKAEDRHHRILENAKRSDIEETPVWWPFLFFTVFFAGLPLRVGSLANQSLHCSSICRGDDLEALIERFPFSAPRAGLLINPRHKKSIKVRKQVKPEQTDYLSMSSDLERRRKRKRRRHETWKRIWLDERKRAIEARSRGSLCKQGSRNATDSCLMLQARDVLPIPFCHSVTWWSPLEKIKQTTLERSGKKKKLESPEKTSSSGLSTEYYLVFLRWLCGIFD